MNASDEEIFLIGGVGCLGTLTLLTLLLTLIQLASLGRALAACSPARRTLEPVLVWLNLVPVFHLGWKFWTIAQVGQSLRNEFDARGLSTNFSFGRTLGSMVPIMACLTRLIFWCGMFVARAIRSEELVFLVILATLILGVMEVVLLTIHVTQINGYLRQLNLTRSAAPDVSSSAPEEDWGERYFDEDYNPITRRRGTDE